MNTTFGLETDTWIALNAIGAILTAVGMIVAVIVALRIARHGAKETNAFAILLLPAALLLGTFIVVGTLGIIFYKRGAAPAQVSLTDAADDMSSESEPGRLFRVSNDTVLRRRTPSTALLGRATNAIRTMEEKGLLRVETDLRKAWIDPVVWGTMDAQLKEDTTAGIALFCSPRNPVVELYDKQSARKLASYGRFRGFRVEQ